MYYVVLNTLASYNFPSAQLLTLQFALQSNDPFSFYLNQSRRFQYLRSLSTFLMGDGGDIIELLLLDAGDMLLDNDDFDNGAMEPRKVAYAINPVSHGADLPVSEPNVTMESSSDSESSDMTDTAECGAYRPEEDDQPVPLIQAELKDLTQGLNLSKESAQLLGSDLQEKRLLVPGTTFHWYREREREFRYLFTIDKAFSLAYCNNIAGLIEFLGLTYGSSSTETLTEK